MLSSFGEWGDMVKAYDGTVSLDEVLAANGTDFDTVVEKLAGQSTGFGVAQHVSGDVNAQAVLMHWHLQGIIAGAHVAQLVECARDRDLAEVVVPVHVLAALNDIESVHRILSRTMLGYGQDAEYADMVCTHLLNDVRAKINGMMSTAIGLNTSADLLGCIDEIVRTMASVERLMPIGVMGQCVEHRWLDPLFDHFGENEVNECLMQCILQAIGSAEDHVNECACDGHECGGVDCKQEKKHHSCGCGSNSIH
jgi:hypothetical protein